MDPSFLQLSRTVHQEKLQSAAKEQHFRNVGIPEEARIVTRRSIKLPVLLITLAILIAIGF